MQFVLLSDLHNEFDPFIVPEIENSHEKVLVLAGDIGVISKSRTITPFLLELSARFKHIIYVFGNHEFYNSSIKRAHDKLLVLLHKTNVRNVSILENEVKQIGDVSFIGATLWTDFNRNPSDMMLAGSSMSDHRMIRTGPTGKPYAERFRPEKALEIHNESVGYVFDQIKEEKQQGQKTVVVTHHLPTYKAIAPEFRDKPLNSAYASELFDKIYDSEPDMWVFGHSHTSTDFTINKTRLRSNPRGYSPHGINPDFNPTLTLTI